MAEKVQYDIYLRDLMSSGLLSLTKKTDALDAKMKQIQTTAKQTESKFANFGNSLKGALAGVGLGLFAKSVVDTGVAFEGARVRLNTLLKDSQKADEVFNQIKKDAATTPFSFQELLQGNTALISTGISASQAREDILALGNAVAATGGGNEELQRMSINLQQIRNNGKATGVDVKQFGIAGINMFQLLAASTGKTVQELQGMDITYEMITQALIDARAEGGMFANGLENMSKSVGGQISNLGDKFDEMKDKFFVASREGIQAVINGLTKLMEIGFKVAEMLGKLFKWISDNRNMLTVLGITILSVVAYMKLTALWASLMAIQIGGATIATGGLSAAFTALSFNPFTIALAGAGAFIIALLAIKAHLSDVRRNDFEKGIADMKQDAAKTALENINTQGQALSKKLGITETEGKLKAIATEKNLIRIDLERQREKLKSASGGERQEILKQIAIGKSQLATISQLGNQLARKEGTGIQSLGGKTSEIEKAKKQKKESLGSSVEKVSGQRSQIINVNIGKMIEGFTITTNNLAESKEKIREQVIQVMVTALNDAQVIAQG